MFLLLWSLWMISSYDGMELNRADCSHLSKHYNYETRGIGSVGLHSSTLLKVAEVGADVTSLCPLK